MEDFKLDITVDNIVRKFGFDEIHAIGCITELHCLVRTDVLENKMGTLINHIISKEIIGRDW